MASYGDGTRYGSGARYDESSKRKTKMSKFKRDLKNDPIPNKTTRGEEIIAACTGNADLGTLTAELTAFTTSNGALKTTASDLAAAQAAVTTLAAQQATDEDTWNTDYEGLLAKMESNTKGEKVKMATTTVPTYEPGAAPPAGPPAKVTNLSMTIGDMPKELDFQWDNQRPKPRLFLVRICEGTYNQANMQVIGMPSGSKFTATNLLSGHTYWGEVAAVGSGNQQGPWSDPATGMAM